LLQCLLLCIILSFFLYVLTFLISSIHLCCLRASFRTHSSYSFSTHNSSWSTFWLACCFSFFACNTLPSSLIDSNVNLKWTQWKSKELGHTPWFTAPKTRGCHQMKNCLRAFPLVLSMGLQTVKFIMKSQNVPI
jgi:hypothetical protein